MTTKISGTSGIEFPDGDKANAVVGTVSQEAGIPTGAIIERGSNELGEYIKYADGALICSFLSSTGYPTNSGSGSLFVSSALGLTFPHPFSTSVGLSVTAAGIRAPNASARCWDAVYATSATTCSWYAFSATTDAYGMRPGYIAIGRWF